MFAVALDGPAGAGKSSIAKAAAKEKSGPVHKRVFIPKMHHDQSEKD